MNMPHSDPAFDLTIGKLDFILSVMKLYAKQPGLLGPENVQTLKHHADDMISLGRYILSKVDKKEEDIPTVRATESLSGEEAMELRRAFESFDKGHKTILRVQDSEPNTSSKSQTASEPYIGEWSGAKATPFVTKEKFQKTIDTLSKCVEANQFTLANIARELSGLRDHLGSLSMGGGQGGIR